jgi:hypothetical protein
VKWDAAPPSLVFYGKPRKTQWGQKEGVYILPNVMDIAKGYLEVESADEWVRGLNDDYLHLYVAPPDNDFWLGVAQGVVLYHGTTATNARRILRYGLEPRHESRSISNRFIGAAVFLSPTPQGTEAYGDTLLAVDVGAMKRDGVTPQATFEPGVEERGLRSTIAYRLGLHDYHDEDQSWEGIADDTIIVHGRIPPQYISVVV